MDGASPEEERRELQLRLNEELGPCAPRLGPHPDRVKANAAWVWLGAAVFTPVAHVVNGDGDLVPVMGTGAVIAAAVCAAVAFGYDRLFWREVEKARAAHRERQGGSPPPAPVHLG